MEGYADGPAGCEYPHMWASDADRVPTREEDHGGGLEGGSRPKRPGPYEIAALMSRAGTLMFTGRKEEAVELIAEAARIGGPGHNAHMRHGIALMDIGRHAEAARVFKAAAAADPGSARWHIFHADACARLGRGEDALKSLGRAVRTEPRSMYARMEYASALRKAGHGGEAIAEYAKAARIDVGDPAPRIGTGRIHLALCHNYGPR